MNTNIKALALLVAAIFSSVASAQEAEKSDIGAINITGEGDRLGAGQIIQEDSAKARSTVTKAAIEKQRSTSNAFQALQLLPGVNTYNHDATGLFGGGLRVRGFNSDQMGYTVDGAPVNDSGSFSVFPQEYTDQENTCEIFLTQGSSDTDAPHVGATGGNVGIVTCDPLEQAQFKLQQTWGSLSLEKTFARFDSGSLPVVKGWRSFVSVSRAHARKFKGPGEADRDHVDAKTMLDLGGGSRLVASALLNEAVNNNYRTLTKAQIQANGDRFDFSDHFIPNPAGGPGRQSVPVQDTYYGLSLNQFRNALFTSKANIQLNPAMRVDVEPYFWYGYGSGGTQQFSLNEGGTFRGGVQDINGDGDRLDQVLVFRSSVTKTHRPGVTTKFNWNFDDHKLIVGYWYERARHIQTGPATRLNSNGAPADLWLQGQYILRADGTPYNLRDQVTITEVNNVFLQDSIALLNERLNVQLGIKAASIMRDFTNFANEGSNQGIDYQIAQKFNETLPSAGVRYQISERSHVFANLAKNYKVPGNFIYGGAYVNGVLRSEDIKARNKAETSINLDIGYRYQGEAITFSGSVFNVAFKDRLARSYNPETALTIDTNVGDATTRGVELEIGSKPLRGFSAYASLAYTKSKINSDLQLGASDIRPTAGKEFPDVPNWLAGASLQYASGAFYATLQAKYTGKRYSTLTNDDQVGGYTTTDLNLGYRLPASFFLRNSIIRMSVSNLFNKDYLALNAGSGSLFTVNATGSGASSPNFYVGAPRFASISFATEF